MPGPGPSRGSGRRSASAAPQALLRRAALWAALGSAGLAAFGCDATAPKPAAAAAASPSAAAAATSAAAAAPEGSALAAALEPGPLEAVVVYRAPAKAPPPVKAEAPRPKPEASRPEPPKPTGPSAALVAAQRELAALMADSSALAAAQSELAAAQAELRSAGGAVAAQLQSAEQQLQATSLARELETQQVRNNQCCSVCGNSKTELEKSGKRFLDHLLEVKGTVARCAPSKLAEVERRYEQRLAAQRAQVQQLKNQVGPQRAAAQAKVDAAQAKLDSAKREREAKIREAQDKVKALGG